jgi:hypothetical protein
MKRKLFIILSCSEKNYKNDNRSHLQLNLWESPQIPAPEANLFHRNRPQIVSIPGVSLKEQHRYRVMLGHEILGDQLTIDEAVKLVKRGES